MDAYNDHYIPAIYTIYIDSWGVQYTLELVLKQKTGYTNPATNSLINNSF